MKREGWQQLATERVADAKALLVTRRWSAERFGVCPLFRFPYAGFYHVGRHGRPSLALDLIEEFRDIIADSVVLILINNRVLSPSDFLMWRESCQLTDEGRKKFFVAYETRKVTLSMSHSGINRLLAIRHVGVLLNDCH
jgi:hypothetical protein